MNAASLFDGSHASNSDWSSNGRIFLCQSHEPERMYLVSAFLRDADYIA